MGVVSMRSILIFTVHKAGSMFVHRLTDFLTHQIHMPYYSPNKGNFPDYAGLSADLSHFKGKTGCIGPLRQYWPINNIDSYSIILHLRDPRDMLVSLFFMHTHRTPGPRRWMRNAIRAYPYPAIWQLSLRELVDIGVLQAKRLALINHYRRKQAARTGILEKGIDQYVLKEAEAYYPRYATYCEKLLGRDNVTLLRYEDMVSDFDRWFAEFIVPFGDEARTAISARVMDKLRSTFQMQGEDRKSHKRKVTPGDHKEKLASETIAALNERFSDVLDALGYAK
jgi:hypothetical protein